MVAVCHYKCQGGKIQKPPRTNENKIEKICYLKCVSVGFTDNITRPWAALWSVGCCFNSGAYATNCKTLRIFILFIFRVFCCALAASVPLHFPFLVLLLFLSFLSYFHRTPSLNPPAPFHRRTRPANCSTFTQIQPLPDPPPNLISGFRFWLTSHFRGEMRK